MRRKYLETVIGLGFVLLRDFRRWDFIRLSCWQGGSMQLCRYSCSLVISHEPGDIVGADPSETRMSGQTTDHALSNSERLLVHVKLELHAWHRTSSWSSDPHLVLDELARGYSDSPSNVTGSSDGLHLDPCVPIHIDPAVADHLTRCPSRGRSSSQPHPLISHRCTLLPT